MKTLELLKTGIVFVNFVDVDAFIEECRNKGVIINGGALDEEGQWFYL